MALKFGRSTVKTTDPQGNRIADPEVVGRKTEYGTVSSWPEVKKLYQAGKLKGTFEGRKTNPDIMKYLSGKENVLSDVEYDEPVLDMYENDKGKYISLMSNLKSGGKQYKALATKQATYGGQNKLGPGQSYLFDAASTISDYTTSRGGAGGSVGTDLETFRKKTDPVPVVEPPVVAQTDPVPAVPTEDKVQPPAAVAPKKVIVKPPVVVEKEELTWENPKFVKAKGVGVPQTKIKQSGKSGVQGAGKKKMVGGTDGSIIKYNTEKRRSSAYYGDNTATGKTITGKTESELRKLKEETKGEIKSIKKEGRFADARDLRGDLSQIRKATRYARDSDISVDQNTGLTLEGQGSNIKYFTPEKTKRVIEDGKNIRNEGAMFGYKDYQAQEKAKTFKSQADNPANRNRSWDRIQGPSEGTAAAPSIYSASDTRSQMKDKFATANPTATPRQIRQGVRTEIKTNRQTQIDLRKKEQEKGMY